MSSTESNPLNIINGQDTWQEERTTDGLQKLHHGTHDELRDLEDRT